jgi:adenylosuccinate synthase
VKIRLIIFGFILMLCLSRCEKDNSDPYVFNNFLISYNRSSGWVDYSYTAVIDQTGLLQITEINTLAKVNRKSNYPLNDNDMLLIRDKLKVLTAIELKDKYGFDNVNAPTDLPVTKVVYRTKDKSDSSSVYYPKENELPLQFENFLKTIEQVISKNDSLIK